MNELLQALVAAVRDLDTDHLRVASVLRGDLGADVPVDPELAALAAELVTRAYLEPGLSGLALLAEAAVEHGDAVRSHLEWADARRVATRPASVVEAIPVQLDRLTIDLLAG